MQSTSIKFNFRSDSIRDESGRVIGKTTKHPSVTVNIPALTADDLLTILEAGGLQLELLLASANAVIYQASRDVVNDAIEAKKEVNQALLDAAAPELTWAKLAVRTPAERKVAGISKDTWEAFSNDYQEVMRLVLVDKSPESIALGASHLVKKFNGCRYQKDVIATLRNYLAAWYANTSEKDDFEEVYNALDSRAELLLNAEDTGRLASML